MIETYTEDDYHEIVESLAEEYDEVIEDNATRDIAASVIAHYTHDDGSPIVEYSTTVYGEDNTAIDRALFPYEVLSFSDASIHTQTDTVNDKTAELAIRCLMADLKLAHTQDTYRGNKQSS